MSKFSNLLKLINYLKFNSNSEKYISYDELSEFLGVSVRMVRKYIDDLKLSGMLCVKTKSGRRGGVCFYESVFSTINGFSYKHNMPCIDVYCRGENIGTILKLNEPDIVSQFDYLYINLISCGELYTNELSIEFIERYFMEFLFYEGYCYESDI